MMFSETCYLELQNAIRFNYRWIFLPSKVVNVM